jgi:asparagine synthase (glutamine-hydrolysing)
MCGIFGIVGAIHDIDTEILKTSSEVGAHRGPEFSTLTRCHHNVSLGFHRLAINGLNSGSNQPIVKDDIHMICNGEIYNYKELLEEMGIAPKTDSDCEVLIHLYEKYGIEGMMQTLDGVFAFVLVDLKNEVFYVGRDTYGVRPMFILKDKYFTAIASEMKQLTGLVTHKDANIQQFNPGTYSKFNFKDGVEIETTRFASFPFMTRLEIPYPSEYLIYKYIGQIGARLQEAVKKRVTTTDRPIACLLSGGLDSSLITALVAKHFTDRSKLETYSIGMEGSEDLKYAEMVAQYLGTSHTSVVVSEEDFLAAIPEVIYAIESYDTTTVRASVGNFLIAKYIKQNSDAKVIFNGDGSDEMSGGYLYFHEAPNSREFDLECKRLLTNIHYFDVLRSDRCIAYHGLEARTPFLDRSLVEHYLTLPKELRNHKECKACEKYILRHCFNSIEILPQEVLWRTKEAFSDGVSSNKKSWFETIQDNIPDFDEGAIDWGKLPNPPKTQEQKYYRSIFERHYPGRGSVIPYFWMPRFTQATDSSARTLNIYDALVKK